MTATLTVESTLTDRYQTTVPESVRRALHLGKRAYGSSTDAYRVFCRMIKSGHPPDDWKTLLEKARQENIRLQDALEKPSLT